MQDPDFLNPLQNPILSPIIWRVFWLYLAGFILIWILNNFSLKNLWKKNIGQRYLSWLILGPIYLGAVLLGGIASLIFLLFVLFLSIKEIKQISKLPSIYINVLYFLSVLSVYIASYQTEFFYSLPLAYFLFITFASIHQNDAKKSFLEACISLFVSIWIIFSLSHFILLGHLNNTIDNSKSLLIFLGFAIPLSDILAYVIGNIFNKINFLDKYKVASNLSPNKSYIGSLGNILGVAIGILIMFFIIGEYLPLYHWVLLSLLLGLGGLAGDITESMFKRFYKAKDSGDLIPGHGGILDRTDSMLRAIVFLYYYLLFFL